ncbi:PD-(D/E)XK nuclease-like domain-containing protein [Shewanella sp. SG41-4]|uniref:PD-(D/E)XK nuclease-like domain-containing protein n=1 Tax=Shewanella sp. SG41-4 TaxID=2760976 RepID=UPI001602BF4A|nr:PD-(D/E)XK nuclease-like domain-containing protein [Shewanella sp. SG41-4]MBB1438254.1 PD-(D/E)XK nuclease-like domain-containing protein [Shewanella sp. SG41-4]
MNTALKSQTSSWHDYIQPAYDDNGKPNFLNSHGEVLEGIYTDMPNEVYHALDAHSSTGIKTFAKGRHHYFRQYLSNICRLRTKQQEFTFDAGTYGHMLVLEPHNFHGNYMRNPVPEDFPDIELIDSIPQLKEALASRGLAVSGAKAALIERLYESDPTLPIFEKLREKMICEFLDQRYKNYLRTDAELDDMAKFYGIDVSLNREAKINAIVEISPTQPIWEKLIATHVIDHIVWDDAFRVQKCTRAHPKADWLLSDGYPELSIIARCPKTGLLLKIRFDWLRNDAIAVDLKTTLSTNPTKFGYQVRDLRYDLQQVFYCYVANLAGVPVNVFAFVATEYKDADNCETFELSQRKVEESKEDLFQYLEEFNEALTTGNWYGHDKSRSTWVIDV